ncbi:hypothetical protein ACIQFU_30470 [Streptomyces sp. NPDC093065]|uniref:hypothetical protein n=1 Tax=Streptomyces sp. NPDC093065 TaxID=3366021 RepID=UPI0038174E76
MPSTAEGRTPPPVQRATAQAAMSAAPPVQRATAVAPAAPPLTTTATAVPAAPPFAAPATPPAAPPSAPPPLPGGGGPTPPVVQRAPARAVPLRKPVSPGADGTGALLPVAPLTPPRPSAAPPGLPVAAQAAPAPSPADAPPDAPAPSSTASGAASGDAPPVQRFFRRSQRAGRTTAALASHTAATVVDNLTRLHGPSSRPGPDGPPPPYEAGAGARPPGEPPPAYAAVPEGGFDPRELTDFQLDELVHRIIGRVTRLVRTELRMDRERIGRLRDPR